MWTKDGAELPDLDRMIVEGRELTFTSLNKTDNGTYRCEATNHLGTSSAEYVLYVYGEFRGKADMWVIVFLMWSHPKVQVKQRELFISYLTALMHDGPVKQDSNDATCKTREEYDPHRHKHQTPLQKLGL